MTFPLIIKVATDQSSPCRHCGKAVIPTASQRWKLKKKMLPGLFCNRACRAANSQRRHTSECKVCGKSITRLMSQVRKSKSGNIFCSPQCGTIWSNWRGPKFKNSSRLETMICDALKEHFPDVKFEFGANDIINSELDIWIPDLNIAIEINGPHHYEPVRKNFKKYVDTIKNDLRKIRAAKEAGIEMFVLNSSKGRGQKAFDRYWPQIRDLIEVRL